MSETDSENLSLDLQNALGRINQLENSLNDLENVRKTLGDLNACYQVVFENTGTAMMVLGKDTTILHCNKKVQEITGYSPDVLINKLKWTQLLLIDDSERFQNVFQNLTTKTTSSELQLHIKDANGSTRDILANLTLLAESKTLISFYDISSFNIAVTALYESERKYRDLYENANDVLFTIDLNGFVTSANETALKIYGYSRKDIPGFQYERLVDPSCLPVIEKNIKDKLSLRKKTCTYEVLTYTKKRQQVWLEISSRLIYSNGSVAGIQCTGRDITQRKHSEEQLRESQRRFKETADLLPCIICEMDKNLYLYYVNEIGLKLFGYTREEFAKGVCVRDLVPVEYQEKFDKIVRGIFEGTPSTPSVYALYRKDNSLIYVLLSSAAIKKNGEFIGIRTCFFDISDRVIAEGKLRLSEERFRSIYSESPIGIALFSPDGFLIDMNESYSKLFGLSDLQNQNIDLFKLLNFNSQQLSWLADYKTVNIETSYQKKDSTFSEELFFDWYITPIGSSNSGLSVYLVQVQDITERKKAQEARLKEQQDATARAEALVAGLKRELREKASFHNMVSRSSHMMQIFDSIPEIAQTSVTVLIRGDSGTGKELVARSLHELSFRKQKPFIAINCSALPDSLLESELFGYKAGAFTDAKRDKPGKFALAEGGTIFLDEIGDISAAMQVKLLRILQEKTYEPLGGTKPCVANVRIIAATNKPLSEMVKTGDFREDLYYRINVVTIKLPPLIERRCDIPLLAELFIERFNDRYGKSIVGVSQEAMDVLLSHDFPGNIRELENIIEHAFIFCKDSIIGLNHLPESLRKTTSKEDLKAIAGIKDFAELERMYLKSILEDNGWCKIKAAEKLGIHKTTLFRKLKQLGIK